ncbi:MAG: hypothetical protein ACYDEF_09405 [Methanosarcina sp.]
MTYKSIPRHPLHLLKGYKLFLEDSNTNEILMFVSTSEIEQIRQFHDCLLQGAHFYHAGAKAKIERYISKRMLVMFTEWKAGKPVSHNGKREQENHPRLSLTFTLLLDGFSESEMIEAGCLESEIEVSKNVLHHMSHQDLLISQLAERTNTTRTTATRLKKIYNDKRNAVSEQNTMVHYEQQITV